ncbi:MAG TPA: hypothetical protein PLU30_11785 [Verrucomicrobiae bacterium]|nr:hypothetical protein [Verrucomicrobiae bacterium]
MRRAVISFLLFGSVLWTAAQDIPPIQPQRAYAKAATWPATMIAARSNCTEWATAAKPKDGALVGTPIQAVWAKIRADWPEQCGWFARDLPHNRHLDWFLHSADTSFETWILRTLPELGPPATGLQQEFEDLRRAKALPSDPSWLELYARTKRLEQVLADSRPLWLDELRDVFVDRTMTMIQTKVPSEDARWATLVQQIAQCADGGPLAHAGGVAALGSAVGMLDAALPGRFLGGSALLERLKDARPRWTGIIGRAMNQDIQALSLLPSMQREVREFRQALLRAVRGMPVFLREWASIDLEQDWENQFEALRRDLANRPALEKFAGETYRPESLVQPTDRDPADIVLRRTAALLADLRLTRAKLAEFEAPLAELQKASTIIAPENAEARYVLFAQGCRLRRQIAFSNPLLNFDRLLFIKRHPAIYNHMCDQYYGITAKPGGALCVLDNAFTSRVRTRNLLAHAVVWRGRLKGRTLDGGPNRDWDLHFDGLGNLSGDETEGGSFLSPDVSFDGKQVVFAYVECRGERGHREHTDPSRGHWDEGRCYHVFKVRADGSNLEQLTDGTWNDFDPCFMPGGRIAFISERRGGYLRCGRVCPTYTLHDMAADGSGIRCLSPHETNEWHPSVAHDGMIVWTRWDYIDRHGVVAHMPWTTTPDGRDPRAVHGNYSFRAKRPDMELDVRAIPASMRFIATAAPHHGQSFGSLIIVDPRARDDDAMGPVKRVTPEIAFPESQGGTVAYGEAWPLSEDYYICVHDPAASTQASGGPTGKGIYGIYLLDAFGNRELIYRDPSIGCHNPMPIAPRPRPPAVSEPAPQLAASGQAEATVAVLDVYSSQKPWPSGTKIKALRVYQVLPQTLGSAALPHSTGVQIPFTASVNVARKILGTVPVETDGSAHFIVPAQKELFFQALDEDGLAVQSMRSATHLQPGEMRTCQGCHEPKARAPVAPKGTPIAMMRPPSRLQPDVDGTNPFSYPRLVQPVLNKHCVACHQQNPDKAPRLDAEPVVIKRGHWWSDGTYYTSYMNLAEKYGFYDYGGHDFGDERAYRTIPGQFGARASKLYPMLLKGHHDASLSPEELHRIAVWLDSTSPFYGVYEKDGGLAQLRGEIAQPTLE